VDRGEPPVAALESSIPGATTLNYRLPQGGAVRLELFDAGGRRVARLMDRFETAGPHSAVADAARLYRLSQGGLR
jgi:hypothetical protein